MVDFSEASESSIDMTTISVVTTGSDGKKVRKCYVEHVVSTGDIFITSPDGGFLLTVQEASALADAIASMVNHIEGEDD